MPSRNKKNKNRTQTHATSGVSAAKNEAAVVKIGDSDAKQVDIGKEPEPQPDLKGTISEAKEKLDQLQQSVDSIKASISQGSPEKSETKSIEPTPAVDSDKCESEQTQPNKKKRNRNRNRKKNSPNADESGVSSTSGTHENSPSPVAPIISTIDKVSGIAEETGETEQIEQLSEIIKTEQEVIVVEAKDNILEEKIENQLKENSPEKCDTSVNEPEAKSQIEQIAPIEQSEPLVEAKPIEPKTIETKSIETKSIENEDRPKDDKKVELPKGKQQKKQRQTKQANKEPNEKTDSNAPAAAEKKVEEINETVQKKEEIKNAIKIDVEKSEELKAHDNQDQIKLNIEPIVPIEPIAPIVPIELKKTEPAPINKNNKSVNEPKKSPKTNKKDKKDNVAAQKPTEQPEQKSVNLEVGSAPKENVQEIVDKDEIPKGNEKLTADKKPEEPKKEKIAVIEDSKPAEIQGIQKENENTAEIKAEIEKPKAVDLKAPETPNLHEKSKTPEKHDKVEKPETQVNNESKKSKAKKSQQSKNQKEQHKDEQAKKDDTNEKPTETDAQKLVLSAVDNEPKIESQTENNEKSTVAQVVEIVDCQVEATSDQVLHEMKSNEDSTVEPEVVAVQPKIEIEAKKVELTAVSSNDEITKTPATTPVLTTPAPVDSGSKSTQQDDETAKIWKILEEASKSLEPVEIQMDDVASAPATSEPIVETNAPIVSTSKDEKEIEAVAKDLVTILETKESAKPKQATTPKAKSAEQAPKQCSPSKATESGKGAEPKKKEAKPAPKNEKRANRPTTQEASRADKTPDKIAPSEKEKEKLKEKEKEKENIKEKEKENIKEKDSNQTKESNPSIDSIQVVEEIPLDVSIMPDANEVIEMNADSKNVQGSGFVPSVESAVVAKSLVPETKISSDESKKGAKSKSKSPMKTKNENGLNAGDKKNDVAQNISPPKEIQANAGESGNKTKESTPASEKRSAPSAKQKESPPKNGQAKGQQNNKKSNSKPVIPPKPDHLVSSQTKKAQVAAAKANKIEKALVLAGPNIDDEDSEDDYIEYKFMPRQVFISTICQSCKKPTKVADRILCQFCQMVSYCCPDHVAKDEPLHKDLCAAIQEIAKKRGGHVYNNARILNNSDYRSLRVHTLNLCENFLKRPLQMYEREILLFPRLCSTLTCREWRQNLLSDCENCGQVFYCTAQPDHLIGMHQRWCNSVALYEKLVVTQSVSGRIEPSLPSRIQTKPYTLPKKIGDVFKDLYKNYSVIKDECVFATLTQLATAPLTAFFAAQTALQQIGEKFTIHLIGAELQFEADVLDIWETFFLHLAPNLMELTIVFCGPELNAENIPLEIISRIRMCRVCRQNCRIVKFDFQCAKFYHDYAKSSAYSKPDLICFFNPGFHHILVTSYTEYESPRDLERFQTESANSGKQMTIVHGPELNEYSSQRPERNFISDEVVPLIFKNYFCFVMK